MGPTTVMRKGIRLNQFLEDRMIMVVGSGILLGALFHSQMAALKPAVSYIFAYITFAVSLGCSLADFKKAVRTPRLMLIMIGLLHIVLPIGAIIFSKIFLPHQPLLQTGVILGTATPIGVSSVIWVGLAGGNLALSLTTIIADTIISPFIVPAVMLCAIGQSVHFDVPQMMIGLAWMIVLPTICGIIVHEISKGRAAKQWRFLNGPATKMLMALIIAVNLGVAWESLHLLKSAIPYVIASVFLMGCCGYLTGYGTARLMKLPETEVSTFIFTVGMRNITAGLVMALKYFPELTAIPVVFAILFQQPMAAVSNRFLVKRKKNKLSPNGR